MFKDIWDVDPQWLRMFENVLKREGEMVETCWNHNRLLYLSHFLTQSLEMEPSSSFLLERSSRWTFGDELCLNWPVSCGRNQELQSQVGQLELTSSGFWRFCRSCGASKLKATPLHSHATSDTFLNKTYLVLPPLSLSLSLHVSNYCSKTQDRSSDSSDHKDSRI